MNNVMVDIETAATTPDASIVSIGAVYFDPGDPAIIGDPFYTVVSRMSQPDRRVDPGTLDWWQTQPDDTREALDCWESNTSSRALDLALVNLKDFLANVKWVWANGADFDLPILAHAWRDCFTSGVLYPYYYSRCHRTLLNLPGVDKRRLPPREGTHHNALDDAIYQAKCAGMILHRLQSRD